MRPQPQNRTVRVFISSTFRDMQEERDYLVKRIFPELRSRCRARQVEFVGVDLRWGITEEQSQKGEVLPRCLAEIENCRPYFIGLLGERYGYVPNEIDPDLIKQQLWLEQHREQSYTELEILHGVLNNPQMAERAFFYFRDPAYLKTLPKEQRLEFKERPSTEEISKHGFTEARRRARLRRTKLAALKKRIRQSRLHLRVDYRNPAELGDWLLEDLWQAIDGEFPPLSIASAVERQATEHLAFAQSRAKGYVQRPRYFRSLDHHARGSGPPLILTGESGVGKTSLLANWALFYKEKHPEDVLILYFIGSTPQSTNYEVCLLYMLEQLKWRIGFAEGLPDSPRKLREALPLWLGKAAGKGRVILILDGLNQLEDRDRAQELGWLPEIFPDKIRVLGSTLPGPSLQAVKRMGWHTLTVEGLKPAERYQVISRYLKIFGKEMEPADLQLLQNAPQTDNPLYLRAILDEIRVLGLHRKLQATLADYLDAPTVPQLFDKILERLEKDYEKERADLVGEALSLLWVAPRGLSEAELRELLRSRKEPLPAAFWSPLYLALQESLVNRSGFLSFFHDFLRQAVHQRYLADPEEEYNYHQRLVEFFDVGFSKGEGTGNYRELSLESARAAFNLAENVETVELRAQAHLSLAGALLSMAVGVSHENAKLFTQAWKMAKTACDIAKKSRRKAAKQALAAGLIYRARFETGGNPDFGNFSFIERAIELFRQCRDPEGEKDALFERAVLAMRLGHWDIVENSLTEAQRLHTALPDPDFLWMAHAVQVWGEYYAHRKYWQKAADTLEDARQRYVAQEYNGGVCAAEGWLGVAKCHLGEIEAGLALVRRALKFERDELESQEGVAKWLQLLGEFFLKQGERQRGLHALWLCEELRETQNHTELSRTRRWLATARAVAPEHYDQYKGEFNPRNSEFGEFAFLWGLGPFSKAPGNPIMAPQGDGWESRAVFNPAAWTDDRQVYLLYRAEGPSLYPKREFCSCLGLAVSTNGLNFERRSMPVLEPTEPYEIPGGCEDPRLVRIGDTFYLTYTAYDGETARLALAVSRDLITWEKRGPVFTDEKLSQLEFAHNHRGWSKSGAILSEKINGYYWMFFGDTHIWAAYSRNLLRWEIVNRPVLSPRSGFFDSYLVEPGPPPFILLDPGSPSLEGIWLGYNAARETEKGLQYTFGQALLASNDPTQVIRRSIRPLLEPETPDERHGQVPQVVFGTGQVFFQGSWLLYYGMADSSIGVAVAKAFS